MSLLIDGGLNPVAVLQEHDTTVFEVAATEGIDLQGKLRLAEKEIRADIERYLARLGRSDIERVVVGESLRLWHAWKTLEAIYRDAYFSQLNDRYGARWKHYKAMAAGQRSAVLEEGIGLVSNPVRRPERPIVVLEPGPIPQGVYQIRVSTVNAQGQESEASTPVPISTVASFQARIKLTSFPEKASGWHLYAGLADGPTGRQTSQPLEIGQDFLLSTVPSPGPEPTDGQRATEWAIQSRRLG